MRDEPTDLPDQAVVEAARAGWGLPIKRVEYAPVGAGSYHWTAHSGDDRWFVKCDIVDSDPAYDLFRSTFRTAAALRDDGLDFVVAPLPALDGEPLQRIAPGWAMSVLPYLDGVPAGAGDWTDDALRVAATALVGRVHGASVPTGTPRWVPSGELTGGVGALLPDLDDPWTDGPFAAEAYRLAGEAVPAIERLVAHYNQLIRELDADDTPWVVTHGEPHSANFVVGDDGRLLLIDWDSVRLAPPERDLRRYFYFDDAGLAVYAEHTGRAAIRPYAADLFRAEWDLSEISWFSSCLSRPHTESPDAVRAIAQLRHYVDIRANWPELT